MKHKTRVSAHMRTRTALNLGIQSDAPRTHIPRPVPWDDKGEGLHAGFRPHGSTERAKMNAHERKMIDAWDNTGGTGNTVQWVKSRTCLRRMPRKKSSDKYDGRTHDVGPVEPVAVDLERKRMSYTQAQQHGMIE